MAKKFENSISDALIGYWENYTAWGRATRTEYWMCVLVYSLFVGQILSLSPSLSLIWSVITIVPGFCLSARRMHDTGRSNWNSLWAFLPIVGWIVIIVFLCQKGETKANKYGPARLKK